MAGLAGRCKVQSNVVEGRGPVILLMARVAGSRQSFELPGSGPCVALLAISQCVRPDEWKAILVIANRIERNLPPFHGVALLAVFPKLGAVNVGVAIGALFAHIGENWAGMAFYAAQSLVHTA